MHMAAAQRQETPTLGHAVRVLASVCDRAYNQDGAGFNRFDSEFGHQLAEIPEENWSPKMKMAAWKMLGKYRKQLAGYGIVYEDIPVPIMEAPADKPKAVKRIELDGDEFIVRFPYDPALVDQVRGIEGRWWNAQQRYWGVPLASAAELAAFAAKYGFQASDEANALLRRETPDPDKPAVTVVDGMIYVRFLYDVNLVYEIKRIAGAKWLKAKRAWVIPLEEASVSALERVVDTFGLVVDAEALLVMQEEKGRGEAMREASRAAEGVDIDIPGLGGELLPFQRAGVDYALKSRRCFIADAMGLGKTVEALATIQAAQAYPAIVVCPASLKTNWVREARKWLPKDMTVFPISGTRPSLLAVTADIVVINYDILKYHVESLIEMKPKAAVFDESHFCKNSKTQRAKAAKELSRGASEISLCLTGTPILNRPNELIAQLDILDRLQEFGGWSAFTRRYCDAYRGAFGFDTSGSANEAELNDRLRSLCYVRRKKEDVLKELPAKRRAEHYVEPDPKVMVEYRRAEDDVVSFLGRRAQELAEKAGLDGDEARWEAELKAEAAEHLVRIGQLKKLAAKAKMPSVFEWIDDFVESDQKLVVFAYHREIVDMVAARYGGLRIYGGDDPDARQRAVDRFMTDPEARVIACSIRAAGVGLTLTAASNVLFLELDWTPAAHDQAEDRCHRIGQQDSVTAWYLLAEGTIDETIYNLIQQKRAVVGAVSDGGAMGALGQSVAGELLIELAREKRR